MGRVFEPGGCSPSCDAELVEVLPTLAWAPEGKGCGEAMEPPRTSLRPPPLPTRTKGQPSSRRFWGLPTPTDRRSQHALSLRALRALEAQKLGVRRRRRAFPSSAEMSCACKDHVGGSNQEAGNRAGVGSNRAVLTAA